MRSRSCLIPLAVALALPASAGAAANGPIVFAGGDGRRSQIFRVEPDGSGLTQLTHAGAIGAQDPAWAPDGTRIAFTLAAERGAALSTTAPDGSGAAPLPVGTAAFQADASYSPDGTQVAFDHDAGVEHKVGQGIFVARSDGRGARRLTSALRSKDAYDTESQWSPDGTQIAFTRVRSTKEAAVFVARLNGSGLRQITPWRLDAASPDWSPDGRRIAFNSFWDQHPGRSANIFTVNPDGTGLAQITHQSGGHVNSFRPSWSPDGRKLVIARAVPKGRQGRLDLYVMNPDGAAVQRLTTDEVAFAATPDWGPAPVSPSTTRSIR
jgi:TolB protein